jgi:hypothetical protein
MLTVTRTAATRAVMTATAASTVSGLPRAALARRLTAAVVAALSALARLSRQRPAIVSTTATTASTTAATTAAMLAGGATAMRVVR